MDLSIVNKYTSIFPLQLCYDSLFQGSCKSFKTGTAYSFNVIWLCHGRQQWLMQLLGAIFFFSIYKNAKPKKNKKGKQKAIEKTARKELEKLEMKKQLEKEQQEKN